MSYVSAGTVRLEYFDVGRGDPTLVLVHGASSSARIWHTVQSLLADTGIRSLAISMRGAGGSDRSTRVEDYNPAVYAADLRAALTALEVGRFVLVGHSLGVSVALQFMRDHARENDVQALVLVAGGAGEGRPAPGPEHVRELEEALSRGEDVDGVTQRSNWEQFHMGLPEDVRDALWRDIQNNPPERTIGQRTGERPDMSEVLASMGVPTMVASGDADDVVPLEATLRCYLKLPEERRHLAVFHGVGHYPNAQVPEQVAASLARFVS